MTDQLNYWNLSPEDLYKRLQTQAEGLDSNTAEKRLKTYGRNSLAPPRRGKGLSLLIGQFNSPLILLLIAAALLSYFLEDRTDAVIIFSIVFVSGILGYFQERGAINAVEKLIKVVASKTTVLRNQKETSISLERIVPGDVVILRAGDLVPADSVIIEANHVFVEQASLTGESLPAEKSPEPSPADRAPLQCSNALFYGSIISSGIVKAVVVATGKNTQYGAISESLRFRPPETAFESGVRSFSYFLLEVTLVLVIVIFALNTYLDKPIVQSLLFSLALAVGLTPQLLPAIISVNLSHGARRMAQKKVIIKRLTSIENFGQMDILCTDKTGTLTEDKISLDGVVDVDGQASDKTALYAFLNANFQTGYVNSIDQAIVHARIFNTADWTKLKEIPYDFTRKRLSVVLQHEGNTLIIAKGAVSATLSVCDKIEHPDGSTSPLAEAKDHLLRYIEGKSQQGYRSLAIAYGPGDKEEGLILLGFLHLMDPVKPGIAATIETLRNSGVHLKIITGDQQAVATHIAEAVGIPHTSVITGAELDKVSDSALPVVCRQKVVFSEIAPRQKERIILALRKAGHIVGYMGDGINDVSALHSADVGIAVDSGAAAAKEVADIVLLAKDLAVLQVGIEEGRRTFVNTLKYVYMATSANFGNMFSMAGASLFLPFLPLLPKQVLLTNFLSDFPEMALATDKVDPERLERPVRWKLPQIRRFMLLFGLLSSVADYLTFGVLLWWLQADALEFRTGWFVESVVSATLIVLAIRTRRAFWNSRPGALLILAVAGTCAAVILLPYTTLGSIFGFIPLPNAFYPFLGGIVILYIASVELAKRFFFR